MSGRLPSPVTATRISYNTARFESRATTATAADTFAIHIYNIIEPPDEWPLCMYVITRAWDANVPVSRDILLFIIMLFAM